MAETQNSKQIVQAPQAGQTVIVNAVPGQDIVLEAAFDQAEVKMDGGNVVFEFANGGQVVLDFTDLAEAQAPNVVMPDGTVLDMQEFLASLGEGDIEPAAGPEGGADGSGGVGEYREGAGDLLEGVNKLNGLEDDPFPAFTLASIEAIDDNPLPTAGVVSGAADEDGLRLSEGAHFEGNDDVAGGDNPARFSYLDGTLTYDFGGDGPAATSPFVWSLVGLPVVFSEGNQLVYEVVDGGLTLNAYYMTEGDSYFPPQDEGDYEYAGMGEGPERIDVFSLKLTDIDDGTFRFELYQPLDHSDTSTEDDINYSFSFTLTDGSGDSVVGGLNLAIDDDSPVATADGSELPSMVLDESSFGSGIVDAPQESANFNIASAISLDGHFTLGSNLDVANSDSTPFVSINAVGNNNYDYYSFTVTQPNTTVTFDIDYAGNQGSHFDSTLRLYDSNGQYILNSYQDDANTSLGGGGSTSGLDSYLVWTFANPGVYHVQVGSYYHGPIQGNGSYQLQISLPNAIMGSDAGDGIRTLATDFSGYFDFDFGADGPESEGEGVNYALSLGDESVASGIYALGEDGQPGEQIMLSLDGSGAIVGTTEGSSPYFSISVDAETGSVTFVQFQNVWHGDTEDHDDAVSIELLEGSIILTATATDGDGDTASASLDLSSGIFAIQDDGPSVVGEPMTETIAEANINTDYSVGTEPGAGPALVSGTLAGLVDFGTDGQGHFAFTADAAAQLEALGLASKQSFFGLKSVALEYLVTQDGNFAVLTATEPDINPWSGDTSNPVFELRLNTVTGQYEFRLYDELVHTGEQDNVVGIDFGSVIQVFDADGDSVVLEGAFTINIQDDEPIANDDFRTINEDTYGLIVGNVTSNDVNGADESLNFKSWDSPDAQYGTFRGYSNGTYSYNLDNALAQRLDDGDSWTETFDYSIRDTDGDISTATLTITIEGKNDRPTISVKTGNWWNANDHVDEAAMPSGSDPDSNAEYAYGTFKVADPDGLGDIESVTINGQTFLLSALVGKEVEGDSGTLTITSYDDATGVAGYEYVLEEATTDVPHKFEIDTFTLTTSDGDLTSTPAYINIVIDDDRPIARNDADTVDVAESGNNHPNMATGNVITGADTDTDDLGADTPGADQPARITRIGFDADENGSYQGSSEVETVGSSGASIDGKYGTLFIKQDGSYEYTVDPQKLPGATLLDPNSEDWSVETKAFQLDQSFFDANGKYSSTGTGGVTNGGNFPANGVDSDNDNTLSVPSQLNYAGSSSEALAFEFGGPVSAATVTVSNLFQNENGGEAARWHAFDADGNRIATGIISQNAVGEPYANSTLVTWDGNNIGTFTVSGIGTFETLVVEAVPYSNDGSAQNDDSDFFATVVSYEALPEGGTVYQEVFKYELTDADGDHSYATLTINGVEPNPEGTFVNQAPVAEDNHYSLEGPSITGNIITDDDDGDGAASGRDWDADTPVTNLSVHSVSWTAGGEPHTQELNGAQQMVNLQHGTLTINPDGSYTYALNEGANGETDSFTYTLEDVHGAVSGSAEVTFTMPDSVPVAYDNYAVAEEGSVSPVNLVVVLDTSGSMFQGQGSMVGTSTRLALAQNALDNLYETYGDNLNSVMFVTFDTVATVWTATSDGSGGWTFSGTPVAVNGLDSDGAEQLAEGSFWMSADAAAAALTSPTVNSTNGGQTDYENALGAVVGGLDGTSSPGGLPTYVYFLSDGNPTQGEINATERGHWVDFINQLPLNIQEVYAIGIGNNVGTNALGTVASVAGNVITVVDASSLPAVLESTVEVQHGNVITDAGVDGTDAPGLDGWGEPVLVSATYGTETVIFSDTVTEHEFVTTAGSIMIRSDGSYDFTPLADVKDDVSDMIKYTVQDGDGSTASAFLHVTTTDASEVDAVDDIMSARPSASVGVDPVDFIVEVPGSMEGIQLAISQVVADPSEPNFWEYIFGDMSSKTSYSQAFSTDVATVVSADIHVQGFRRGDSGSVYLQKQDGNGNWVTIDSSKVVLVSSDNDVPFAITSPGIYRFAVYGDDDSSNGNLIITLKDIKGTVYEYTAPRLDTVTKSYTDVDWVAAALVSGSVITNDSLGSEGAMVVEVDGTSVSTGGTVINGEYGDLTIHPDGSYSYIPNYAPDDADYVGGPLTDSFSYTLEQPDGDYDTALLTFDVTPQLPDGAIVANSDSRLATGADGTDYIFGTSGNDTLEGAGGDDYINGGAGNDYLLGGTGNDHLVGADGNDTLVGGAGDDLMTGGAGSDVFKYVDGDLTGVVHGDTITDFELGVDGDTLDLSALLNGATDTNLANFLDFEVSNIDSVTGTATVAVQVSQNGDGNFTSLATIEVSGATGMDDNAIETMLKAQIDI